MANSGNPTYKLGSMPLAVAQRAGFPGVFSFLGGSKTRTMLGVDINPERIAVAQLKKQGNGRYRLAHYHSVDMPEGAMIEGRILDPSTVGLVLMNLLNENKVPTNLPAATAVPVREAIVRLIRLPADLPADELRRVVLEQEAELYIPYPRDQADVDYQPLGLDLSQDGIERIEVLLVAIPKEVVDNYLEVLQVANLQVRCVELASFSLIRTIRDQLTQYGPPRGRVAQLHRLRQQRDQHFGERDPAIYPHRQHRHHPHAAGAGPIPESAA
jgi:type IV pilus assembly protein PilM